MPGSSGGFAYRIGVDVGGTFTDVVAVDEETGRVTSAKVLTDYDSLDRSLVGGIRRVLAAAGCSPAQVRCAVHGTTLGTNALLEGKGARVGLITTQGFRDVLEFGRVQRPAEGMYDFTVDLPPPLVPRYLRREVPERVDSRGRVVVPLDEAAVQAVLEELRREGIEALAVSFLFSFLYPAHEERVAALAARFLPGVPVSLSHRLAPEFREYERTSTAVINAYLQPLMGRYLAAVRGRLQEELGLRELHVLKASGGTMSLREAEEAPVFTLNSGPAGGAAAAAYFARLAGYPRAITADMGGTSFDVGLVEEGEPVFATEGSFHHLPVKMAMVDIHPIGAGGGSIARVMPGGLLEVGPESARSYPGPACYGLGGIWATVTDADVLLGRLDPRSFLGGEMPLHPDRAREALARLARSLPGADGDPERAAEGVLRVVHAKMVRGIATRVLERGYDPRDYALVVYGGAAPLHGAELAEHLEIRTVLVPPLPGHLSALGCALSRTRYDAVATLVRPVAQVPPEELALRVEALVRQGEALLSGAGVEPRFRRFRLEADFRYAGQSYEVQTTVAEWEGPGKPPQVAGERWSRAVERFHALHRQVYGYADPGGRVEVVHLRLTAEGGRPLPPLRPVLASRRGGGSSREGRGRRRVWFEGVGFCQAEVWERGKLQPGDTLSGPAVVEEPASTTLVPPGWKARVDAAFNLILTCGKG